MAVRIEHYRRAGEMLLEAREQVAPFKWGKWLTKHFELSRTTAFRYMKLAERISEEPTLVARVQQASMRSITQPNSQPANVHWRPVFEATKQVDVDAFTETRQARMDEVQPSPVRGTWPAISPPSARASSRPPAVPHGAG